MMASTTAKNPSVDLELGGAMIDEDVDRRLPLTWQGLHYRVNTKAGVKTLLADVNGVAKASEMFYVMGPSGAGKSTFLDALADRLAGSMREGRVLVDGKELNSADFKKVVKYVQQEDILTAVLTVEETLVYSASFYTKDPVVQRRRAEGAIASLGLEKQRKTPVGNIILRGLSGGQRRRLSVGNELVAAPGILLLDELTSGLDSTAANSVMTSMQKVCRER